MKVEQVKLVKVTDGKCFKYQTEPKFRGTTGRFQVRKTDNANARAIGRRPRWTVIDLYENVASRRSFEELETLADVREWIVKRETN